MASFVVNFTFTKRYFKRELINKDGVITSHDCECFQIIHVVSFLIEYIGYLIN